MDDTDPSSATAAEGKTTVSAEATEFKHDESDAGASTSLDEGKDGQVDVPPEAVPLPEPTNIRPTLYDFTAAGSPPLCFEELRGKVVLVGNGARAAADGLAKRHYKELTYLYERYASSGLDIVMYPCNQWRGVGPGLKGESEGSDGVGAESKRPSDPEGKSAGVLDGDAEPSPLGKWPFRVVGGVDVDGGKMDPVWRFLKEKVVTREDTADIGGNFRYFLIDQTGVVKDRFDCFPIQFEGAIRQLL